MLNTIASFFRTNKSAETNQTNRPAEKSSRILVLGLDNAGKTTLLKNLANEDIFDVQATRGFNVKNLKIKSMDVTLWDAPCQCNTTVDTRKY